MSEKLFYSIGEVAEMFHVKPSLIRFWEQEFDQIKPQRSPKGKRLFTQKDIDWFHQIHHLVKERGYTLQGAKDHLKKQRGSSDQDTFEVIKTLKEIRLFLCDLKNNI